MNDAINTNPDNTNLPNFGRYKTLRLLGEGAMGRVYLSEDPILKRLVAVKVISTDRHLEHAVLSEYLSRFTAEAQACAQLSHPSIVLIYDAGDENGAPWIAFEYVDGERLDSLIARKKQLPFDRVLQIAGDIAAAMQHAHSINIVHRDIKPANILIDEKTHIAKLADFGVVKSPHTSAITQSGTAVGSPGYMSPEQIDNLTVDARSDIFSFGVVLYEMITGTHPFLRDTVQSTFFATVSCNFTPVHKLREDAPEKLVRIVERSLVADRNLRIINAEELHAMIAECEDGGVSKTGIMKIRSAPKGFPAHAKHAYALARRGISSFTKILPQFSKNMFADAADFCMDIYKSSVSFVKDKFIPSLKDKCGKIRGGIESRFTKTQITIAVTGAAALIAAIVLIVLFSVIGSKVSDNNALIKAAQEKGFEVKSARELIDTGRAYIDRCDYWNAGQIADILIEAKDRSHELQGRMFKALSALCADRFNDALVLFGEVMSLDGGENAVRREHMFFIRYLEKDWIERELPEALIDLCAQRLFLSDNHQIKVWTKDRHYWVRWNAVNILRQAGEQVDLVPVYILDLENAASSRTKIRAAEKLGELGDRRAVPPLITVRDSRGNPASSVARRVLRERFNVW